MVASRIAGVCERDIDLLMLEEFQSTPRFVDWFLQVAGVEGIEAHQLRSASRSITDSTGESDLELGFDVGFSSRVVVLIENKLAAGLQPMQAERYGQRGRGYVERGQAERFHTVIVAPDRYFADGLQTKGFEHRVSYDRILTWFENAEELGPRRHYKTGMLRSAIERATLGYQPEIDGAVTDFFEAYWQIAVAKFPELGMVRTRRERPGGSGRVYFKSPELTAMCCDLAHKTSRGVVDLHLRGRGHKMAMVEAALRSLIDPDMTIERAAKSAAIRLSVPVLDRLSPAMDQRDALLAGMLAARRLALWAAAHAAQISRI